MKRATIVALAILASSCSLRISDGKQCVRGHDEIHDNSVSFICDEYQFSGAGR